MNNLMKRENFDFIPRDISGTGQNILTKLDLEEPFVSVDDIIDHIDNRFRKCGMRKISFHDQGLKKTNIRVSPWFDLDQNCWYKMNISLLKEKKYREPQLLYIGLCEGESNTVRNRLNRFFRAVNDQQYESENHQAGVATKKLLDSYGITVYDSNVVEFFVELCEIPKFIHNISPRDIESFMIKQARLNGASLLMNLKL
jgi:hypothetical protein